MSTEKGFTIEVSSRYDGFWRYNVALMCGCFNAADERIGFASSESHVADIGSNFSEKPTDIPNNRRAVLETMPCDHLLLYFYLIPHTLPAEKDIEAAKPFEIELTISYGGKKLRVEKRPINQWSGTSAELRIGKE